MERKMNRYGIFYFAIILIVISGSLILVSCKSLADPPHSLGLQLVKVLTDQLSGVISFDNSNLGFRVRVEFPI